jgi:4-amino-4-deoxy-L-arabinose transferase-like glycosyltransferase
LNRIRGLLTASESPAIWEITILIVILLVATFFRTHLFEAAPPGLQHDEIFKANFALDILDGGWPVFFNPNGGEEALFPYLAALSISLLGHNFFALRLVSLVCGILSILFSYCLIKELLGRRVALLTATGLSISFWHIFDSRVALRPITLVLMSVASFYFFWLALKRGKIVWFVLTGIFLGGTLYTYTSAVLIPVTVILFVLLYQLPFQRDLLFKRWRGILLAFIIALSIFLPMGFHLYTNPVVSTARVSDLSDHVNLFLAGDPGPILNDMLNVAGMFGLRGDPEWRYNLAGRPIFDPLTFLLFCGGLVICLARIKRPEYAFLFLWLVVNLIPSALTRNSPSSLRAIGSLTPIYTLPSLTIDLSWDWATRRFGSLGRRVFLAAVVLLLAFNAFSTYRDYFTVWAQDSEVRDIYRADLSAVARYLNGLEGDEMVSLSASFAADLDQQVLHFMLHEPRFIKWFDGQQALVFPEASSSSDVLYIFPATSPLHEGLLARFFVSLPVADSVPDPHGEPAFVAYRLGPEDLRNRRTPQPRYPLSVNLEDRVELIGYELPEAVEAGSDLPLLLYWRVSQPIRPDLLYAFFAHVVDMRGYVWAQVDTLGYPVSSWLQGDLVIQAFDLAIPPDTPPVEYQVNMGMYDLAAGTRLAPTVEGVALPDDVVSSEPFSVTRAATPPTVEELEIPRVRQANFDYKLNLLGCDLGPLQVSPGDAVHISLYWQALVRPESDYLVSVFLTDGDGNVWGELLRQPLDGGYPTTLWEEGEVVRDRFDLLIESSAPAGRHRLWVRLYDPTTRTYLPLEGADEEYVRVGKVRIDVDQG